MATPTRSLPATVIALAALVALAACNDSASDRGSDRDRAAAAADCDEAAIRAAVETLGSRLRSVDLAASFEARRDQIREQYGDLVTDELLADWLSSRGAPPGRTASDPWPARIEVQRVAPARVERSGECVARGELVLVTSADTTGAEGATRVPVRLQVRREGDGWLVTRWRNIGGPDEGTAARTRGRTADGAEGAANLVRRYYTAISAGDHLRAFGMWADRGAASGQTLEAFAAGFADIRRITFEVEQPEPVEGAAGSQIVRVPVVVRAETTDGAIQRFEGSYTLRRSEEADTTDGQRRWQIIAVDLREIG